MIPLPKEPKLIEKKGNWGKFEIEALYPGYGLTIGHSLRRVLLSSLEGAAVTNMKIEGVDHEFSTIDGVLEDVIEIMMNLKQLNFKMLTSKPKKAILEVSGEKKVKASDFKFPSQVELINEDCHIMTLTDKDAKIDMEIDIETGIGYLSREREKEKKDEKLEIGTIPVDAIFTPIKKVNYDVENMRVGERTDFDRLTVEITTDGSVEPEEAFKEATSILVEHYELLKENATEDKKKEKKEKEKEEKEKKKEDKKTEKKDKKKEDKKEEDASDIEIDDLDLSNRVRNALKDHGIKTVAGLTSRKEETLKDVEGLGKKSVQKIKDVLGDYNLSLK